MLKEKLLEEYQVLILKFKKIKITLFKNSFYYDLFSVKYLANEEPLSAA